MGDVERNASLLVGTAAEVEQRLDSGDLVSALRETIGARDHADALAAALVARLRAEGVSWTSIAAPLGMTRQGAQQRYA